MTADEIRTEGMRRLELYQPSMVEEGPSIFFEIAAQLAELNANLRAIFQVDSKEQGDKTPRLMIDSLE